MSELSNEEWEKYKIDIANNLEDESYVNYLKSAVYNFLDYVKDYGNGDCWTKNQFFALLNNQAFDTYINAENIRRENERLLAIINEYEKDKNIEGVLNIFKKRIYNKILDELVEEIKKKKLE